MRQLKTVKYREKKSVFSQWNFQIFLHQEIVQNLSVTPPPNKPECSRQKTVNLTVFSYAAADIFSVKTTGSMFLLYRRSSRGNVNCLILRSIRSVTFNDSPSKCALTLEDCNESVHSNINNNIIRRQPFLNTCPYYF